MTLEDRAKSYNLVFPNYPKLVYDKNWLYGIWMIGNNYRNKAGYYGEYPPSYLKRIHSLFPDAQEVCHLFSGKVEEGLWNRSDGWIRETTIDINGNLNPDFTIDAHIFSNLWKEPKHDLIVADPPYSQKHADKYGTKMINRKKVVSECYKALIPNGYLVWLDVMLPMYRKAEFKLVGTIGLVRSTNHRFRLISIFERQ